MAGVGNAPPESREASNVIMLEDFGPEIVAPCSVVNIQLQDTAPHASFHTFQSETKFVKSVNIPGIPADRQPKSNGLVRTQTICQGKQAMWWSHTDDQMSWARKIVATTVATNFKYNKLSLIFFDPSIEELFLRKMYGLPKEAHLARGLGWLDRMSIYLWILICAVVLTLAVILPDYFRQSPNFIPVVLPIRVGSAVILFLCFVAIYTQQSRKVLEIATFVCLTTLYCSNSFVVVINGFSHTEHSAADTTSILVFVYLLVRMRFWIMFCAGFFAPFWYLLARASLSEQAVGCASTCLTSASLDKPFFAIFFEVFVANLMGVVLAYYIEERYRSSFIKEAKLKDKRRQQTQAAEGINELLGRMLPQKVIHRLHKMGEHNQLTVMSEYHDEVTVLMSDVVGFTSYSSGRSAEEVVGVLNEMFNLFDDITRKHELRAEKIKTLGDAYMVVSGAPEYNNHHHCKTIVLFGLAMMASMDLLNERKGTDLQLRIGIDTGEGLGGVIYTKKLSYELWGATVNGSCDNEQGGVPGRINCSEAVVKILNEKYPGEFEFDIDAKRRFLVKPHVPPGTSTPVERELHLRAWVRAHPVPYPPDETDEEMAVAQAKALTRRRWKKSSAMIHKLSVVRGALSVFGIDSTKALHDSPEDAQDPSRTPDVLSLVPAAAASQPADRMQNSVLSNFIPTANSAEDMRDLQRLEGEHAGWKWLKGFRFNNEQTESEFRLFKFQRAPQQLILNLFVQAALMLFILIDCWLCIAESVDSGPMIWLYVSFGLICCNLLGIRWLRGSKRTTRIYVVTWWSLFLQFQIAFVIVFIPVESLKEEQTPNGFRNHSFELAVVVSVFTLAFFNMFIYLYFMWKQLLSFVFTVAICITTMAYAHHFSWNMLSAVLGVNGFLAFAGFQIEKKNREVFLTYQRIHVAHQEMVRQRSRSENLLTNIMPSSVIAMLKENPESFYFSIAESTVLFVKIAKFHDLLGQLETEKLMILLNHVFGYFDDRIDKHPGCEKIKCVEGGIMVATGVPVPDPLHPHADTIATLALDIMRNLESFNSRVEQHISLKMGIHSGPLVAGVLGSLKPTFDVFGDTVNTSSRMESSGTAGTIQVSEASYQLLHQNFILSELGMIEVKGKGPLLAYRLESHRFMS
eukprot:gnl/Spiro4/8592_TR4500_c0_g1_i1.p1 gnl/Spiro4/8592_TR4500_c0_g1~~gnl/Spiro4/8592_TR4500_c0_g1_i1.p1  ORF type:complete len:1138 (-),score=279.30 gnl/Spiro4/8592_TR4500_c0_g1_i1:47-3460(-)